MNKCILNQNIVLIILTFLLFPSIGFSDGENMIRNPGFENGAAESPEYQWRQNNWAKNDVEFTLDPQCPYSGKYSQRITLRRILNVPDLQFHTFALPVKPGMALRVKFWLKGESNTPPITVKFRKLGAPYTSYWHMEIVPTNNWKEHVLVAALPDTVDTLDTSLMFSLQSQSTIWLDDVTVAEMPHVDSQPPIQGNLIANGSFEVGTDYWYAGFRESTDLTYSEIASEKNISARLASELSNASPDGVRVLHFSIFEHCKMSLTSAYFPMRYNIPAIIGFQLKSSRPGCNFRVRLNSGDYATLLTSAEKQFTSPDTKWHTYQLPVVPKPSGSGTYFLELISESPADYELDAVCVNEGDHLLASDQCRRFNVGVEAAEDKNPANIFYTGDYALFRVRVESNMPKAEKTLFKGRVVDVWGRVIHQFELNVPTSKDGYGESVFVLPTNAYGGFKCELWSKAPDDSCCPSAELIYSVVPKLPRPNESENSLDSFYGGHVWLTPYNLLIAEKAGFRWLRLHPPFTTKWMMVEQSKGVFRFFFDGIKRANTMGFRILGSLDTTPKFYAIPGIKEYSYWGGRCVMPGDWEAYRKYVTTTVQAFKPYVDCWEIWNEPNQPRFLQIPKGKDRDQAILEILRNTRLALDEACLNVPLVAPGYSSVYTPGFHKVVSEGIADIDSVSFHFYNESIGVEELSSGFIDRLDFIRTLKNHSGKIPDIWMSEGGVSACATWLKTSGIPQTQAITVLEAANTLVRQSVALKALGLKKYFHYQDFAHPSGRLVYLNETNGMIDNNGIPHPSLAAHATMVRFLDNAKPEGLYGEKRDGTNLTIARFRMESSMRGISVIWSYKPILASKVIDLIPPNTQLYNMMGNPLTSSDELMIDRNPIYCME